MTPRLSPWLIPLLVPMAVWARLMRNPFIVQVMINYAAAAARVGSWFIVAGLVYRRGGADELAILMLLRGTVGLLSYTSLGLTPALVQILSKPVPIPPVSSEPPAESQLSHEPVEIPADRMTPRRVFNTAFVLTLIAAILGIIAAGIYGGNLRLFHQISKAKADDAGLVAMLLGAGVMVRILSDVFGAKLMASRALSRDAICQIIGEIAFVIGTIVLTGYTSFTPMSAAAIAFLLGNIVILAGRAILTTDRFQINLFDVDPGIVKLLLAGGSFVLLAQIADWLYAPANQILIDRFLGTSVVADYVPAIQVDGAMLLLASGLATVLFPYTATAFHHQKWNDLRIYYLFGTIFSLIILTIGAVVICLIDGWLFTKWFGDPLPATQAILPLVMIHTVAGGSASIGRSVLFGMGRIKPYAIAAIIGGIANVGLAILFLTTTDLGLKGIILATVITVTLRCLIWLPIYTMWSIRQVGGPLRIHWH